MASMPTRKTFGWTMLHVSSDRNDNASSDQDEHLRNERDEGGTGISGDDCHHDNRSIGQLVHMV